MRRKGQNPPNKEHRRGQNVAMASLITGFAAFVTSFFGEHAYIGIILGVLGVTLSAIAWRMGNFGAARTGGYVLSLLAIIIGSLMFAACGICIGTIHI